MGRKAKPAQDLKQMTGEMVERKQNRSPESRMYSRSESLAAVDSAVTGIVTHLATEFNHSLQVQADGRIRLSDADQIADRIQMYLQACAEAATLPTMTGFSRSIGYSYERMRQWRVEHPDSETADMLTRLKEICAEALELGGLKGASNAVVSIFLLKANHGYRDALTLETASQDRPILSAPADPAEIAERYALLLDDIQENN